MTKLDELIEQIQSDDKAREAMGDLLEELLEARTAMSDPADEAMANEIAGRLLQKYLEGAIGAITEEDDVIADADYMEKTSAAVEEAFDTQGWKNYSKRSVRSDLMQYELGFNVENTKLRISVLVEDAPKRIRVYVVLPIAGEKTYEYLLSKAIVDANKRFVFGAFQYDQEDGELTYEYSYPVKHGFYKDDFLSIVHAVIRTAVDDDAYASIKKAAQGKYKRTEREAILRKIAPLVEELTD